MAKVTINFPVTVECDIEPISQDGEAAFNLSNTDVVRIKNAKLPASIVLPAHHVLIEEEVQPEILPE